MIKSHSTSQHPDITIKNPILITHNPSHLSPPSHRIRRPAPIRPPSHPNIILLQPMPPRLLPIIVPRSTPRPRHRPRPPRPKRTNTIPPPPPRPLEIVRRQTHTIRPPPPRNLARPRAAPRTRLRHPAAPAPVVLHRHIRRHHNPIVRRHNLLLARRQPHLTLAARRHSGAAGRHHATPPHHVFGVAAKRGRRAAVARDGGFEVGVGEEVWMVVDVVGAGAAAARESPGEEATREAAEGRGAGADNGEIGFNA